MTDHQRDAPAAPTAPTAPDSSVERTLVARGWSDIDLAERLGSGPTRRLKAPLLEAAHERARAWYRAPVDDHVPEGMVSMYESEANVVRYRRLVDFLTEGERVFEVGLGYGYLATMMLREGRLGRYHGVDLVPDCVERTTKMLAVNGLSDNTDVTTKDLYDVTSADLEDIDASLLVCCEVIEHVPDPETALSTLARALPEGVDLLFSVPLYGRLETVWGHGQVFGAARLQQMLHTAGLVPHHVEVLHDTWALVLASTDTRPSPRAAAVLEGTVEVDPQRLLSPPFRSMTNQRVTEIPRAESQWTKRVGDAAVSPCKQTPSAEESPATGLRVTARAERITSGPGRGWSACAGVAFAAPEGAKGVRLEVDIAEWADVADLCVEFRRDGERTGLWKWKVAKGQIKAKYPTFLIAPGRGGLHLRRVPGASSEGADTVEVYVRAHEDQPIDFSILRWSWVS